MRAIGIKVFIFAPSLGVCMFLLWLAEESSAKVSFGSSKKSLGGIGSSGHSNFSFYFLSLASH
jgi:hypothetical protein